MYIVGVQYDMFANILYVSRCAVIGWFTGCVVLYIFS